MSEWINRAVSAAEALAVVSSGMRLFVRRGGDADFIPIFLSDIPDVQGELRRAFAETRHITL